MKRVLMICYYYPPITSVGSKRSVAFSKYMHKKGWEPIVMSVKNPIKEYVTIGGDQPPKCVRTEYVASVMNPYKAVWFLNGVVSKLCSLMGFAASHNYFYSFFCIPDYFFGWIPTSFVKGVLEVRRQNIDAVYVSCSPFSSAITGVLIKLAVRKTLVVDFRDPFATGKMQTYAFPRFRVKMNKLIERFILRHADHLIVTSKGIEADYGQAYPQWKQKISTIYNGFDGDNLALLTNHRKFKKFTVCYTGQFYSFSKESRPHTTAFFSALAELKHQGEINAESFQFIYYGPERSEIDALAKSYDVTDLVKTFAPVPYSEIVGVIQKSHLQLLRIVPPMISTKLFEGIPMNVPFLATIPKGEVESIIGEYSPQSYCCTSETSGEVSQAILSAIDAHKRGVCHTNHCDAFMNNFSREHQVERLLGILGGGVGTACGTV